MYYVVDDGAFRSDDPDEVVEFCINDEYHDSDDDYYEEWVNETYGSIDIGGTDYTAYEILRSFENECGYVLDLYREEMNESDKENGLYELRHAENGETIYIQNSCVRCYEEEEEPEEYTYPEGENFVDNLKKYVAEMNEYEQYEIETDRKIHEDYMNLFQRF